MVNHVKREEKEKELTYRKDRMRKNIQKKQLIVVNHEKKIDKKKPNEKKKTRVARGHT